MLISLNFVHSMHAALNRIYDPKSKRRIQIGQKGTYGPIDPETGAEYRVIADEIREGIPYVCKDYDCGAFYPETLFVFGRDEKNEPLDFEQILNALSELHIWRKPDPCRLAILPRGWSGKTGLLWEQAIWWDATHQNRPTFWQLEEKLKDIPNLDISRTQASKTVTWECPQGSAGAPEPTTPSRT